MDEAGRHHALRGGKEAVTLPWRSVQDAEKANETVAWQALPCRQQEVASKHRKTGWRWRMYSALRGEMAQDAASRFSSIRRKSRFGGCGLELVDLTRAEGESG
jgi:hypothetical protein